MADVVYRDIIVLTPEERHGDELLAASEHVERSGLALSLGDNPVLDADVLAAVSAARIKVNELLIVWVYTLIARHNSREGKG
jgi:hypothetical protein